MKALEKSNVENNFVAIASKVSITFPDLDLRFVLEQGKSKARYIIATVSSDAYEVDLSSRNTQEIINDTILHIKQIARLFDD